MLISGLSLCMKRLSLMRRFVLLLLSRPNKQKSSSEISDLHCLAWSLTVVEFCPFRGFFVSAEIPICSQNLLLVCRLDSPM